MASNLCLDAIVTRVDAMHGIQHLDDSDEVRVQIAFADSSSSTRLTSSNQAN